MTVMEAIFWMDWIYWYQIAWPYMKRIGFRYDFNTAVLCFAWENTGKPLLCDFIVPEKRRQNNNTPVILRQGRIEHRLDKGSLLEKRRPETGSIRLLSTTQLCYVTTFSSWPHQLVDSPLSRVTIHLEPIHFKFLCTIRKQFAFSSRQK